MTQAEWTRALYQRVRPHMPADLQASFDDLVDSGEMLLACIDLIGLAAVERTIQLTPTELRTAQRYADDGKLLKSSAHLAEQLRAVRRTWA